MKKLISSLLLLAAAIWTGLKIKADPGYIFISYQQWSIETTVWLFILSIVVFFLLLYAIIRLLKWIASISDRFQVWKTRKRIRRSRRKTSRGLCELAEGNWVTAEQSLIQAAKRSETPLINYLAAARAAQEQGAFARRDEYLQLAHASTSGAEVAVALTQAELQLHAKQLEQALATLKHLNRLVPHHTYVLNLLQGVYYELHEWEDLQKLLPKLNKHKVLKPEAFAKLEQTVYLELLRHAINSNDMQAAQTLWQQMPKALQKDELLMLNYTSYLIKINEKNLAEKLLRDALNKNWYSSWITQYAATEAKDPAKQITIAKSWLKDRPQDPDLLLCLGKLCAHHQLWGQAREYLETTTQLSQTSAAYQILGHVLEQMGDQEGALACYRKGLTI